MQSKHRRTTPAAQVALGGVLAAAALVIMNMGTLIPVATYVCPMLCITLLELVRRLCGSRMAWAWYGCVAILSALMAPDKEAAAVFIFLGYYPIVRPWIEGRRGKWLIKALLFNGATLLMYWVLMHLLGMERIVQEFSDLGIAMTALLLILGNVTFFLLDMLLAGKRLRRR